MSDSKKRLPDWLKRRLGSGQTFNHTHHTLGTLGLETICTNANCPNRGECWSRGTATVLILGNICTRNCKFCSVGHGKPVWMVLQAFSWHTVRPDRSRRYPSFVESRFMAYDAIVHGVTGTIWWGVQFVSDPAFTSALYALTSELAALQPFLVAPSETLRVRLIEPHPALSGEWGWADPLRVKSPGLATELMLGVRAEARRAGNDWAIVVVNEDDEIRPVRDQRKAVISGMGNSRLCFNRVA